MARRKPIAIDLFSGCGGLTYGLKAAGFRVLGALELDPLAFQTFKLNHPSTRILEADITNVDPLEWMKSLKLEPGELDLLAGCPPCQGFSNLRTLNGSRTIRDKRNQLLNQFQRFVEAFQPQSIMIENVPGLRKKAVYKNFLSALRKQGYICNWTILDAAKFNVPQHRKRLVMLAGKGFKVEFAKPNSEMSTVRNAIGDLPTAGKSGDILHDFPERRSPEMRDWISKVPSDGGSRGDLPEADQRNCHKRLDGFKDTYGRMAWDKPSPTITSGCFNPSKGRFLHPLENRNITMREAALLQSFPKEFTVPDIVGKTAAALMIGNALPPKFVQAQAENMKRCLIENHTN
jgi:DNA (cytosine-5)-methyltransferase 1